MASIKNKLARSFNSNVDLNRKALNLKRSWDEIATLLRIEEKNNKSK